MHKTIKFLSSLRQLRGHEKSRKNKILSTFSILSLIHVSVFYFSGWITEKISSDTSQHHASITILFVFVRDVIPKQDIVSNGHDLLFVCSCYRLTHDAFRKCVPKKKISHNTDKLLWIWSIEINRWYFEFGLHFPQELKKRERMQMDSLICAAFQRECKCHIPNAGIVYIIEHLKLLEDNHNCLLDI